METSLSHPVKTFLEGFGYDVKGEVGAVSPMPRVEKGIDALTEVGRHALGRWPQRHTDEAPAAVQTERPPTREGERPDGSG